MMKNYVAQIVLSFFLAPGVYAQEIEIFKVQDFDLNGKVKSCLVITDYGRESFEFNADGILIKSVTQYNDTDQDITYYKYNDDELVERRMESYKNNVLDATTSMVNFYEIDTVPQRRVLEKIISYDKEFLEQQEYLYDADGRLSKIITSNSDGVDETTFEYTPYKDELTTSIFTNGVLEKSIRTSQRKGPKGTQKIVLTKEYIDGEPNVAIEEVFNAEDKILTYEHFQYENEEKEFVSQRKLFYHYNQNVLEKVITKTVRTESVENYIFQFDSNPEKNWVKKIITPENTYTTRVITYYPPLEETEEGSKG